MAVDFEQMLISAEYNKGKVVEAVKTRTVKRFKVSAFPAYKGDPWYFSNRTIALIAARWRSDRFGFCFPDYAEVRVTDLVLDKTVAVL